MSMHSRPPLDARVVELLRIVTEVVAPASPVYAIAGGIAVLTYGIARNTADVDVFLPDNVRKAVFSSLRENGLDITPIFPPFHYMAWLPQHGDPRIHIDLMFPNDDLERYGMKHPVRGGMWGMEYNVLSPTVLAAIKFKADSNDDDSHRHLDDVTALYKNGIVKSSSVKQMLEQEADEKTVARFLKHIQKIDRSKGGTWQPRKPK